MAKKKIQLQDANGNVLHPLTLGECVTMSNGENLDTLMSKSQMFTPAITQNKSMFKVGTGVDVDYSANVKDGAYESLVFKGKSLVNIHPISYAIRAAGATTYFANMDVDKTKIKCGTRYFLRLLDTDPTVCSAYFKPCNVTTISFANINDKYAIFTTKSELTDSDFSNNKIHFYTNTGKTLEDVANTKIILCEYQEGMENWDIPYFTGLCDSKMPILRNTGKNLFDPSKHHHLTSRGDCYSVDKTSSGVNTVEYVLEPNSQYILSFNKYGTNSCWISVTINGAYSNNNNTNYSKAFTTNSTGKTTIKIAANGTSDIGHTISNIMLRKANDDDIYEDRKTNILRTSEEIVLREVNGVQDTYNALTGEYVQRIGEVVVTNTVSKSVVVLDNNIRVNIAMSSLNGSNGTTKVNNTLSDKFCWSEANAKDVEGLRVNGNTFHWCVSKNRLTSQDLQGVNTWLQSNPVTIQYELAEPITTIVKPSTMTPFAYQNGHVILESGFEGQSLLPEIEYSVVTGRAGQVTQNTKVLRKQEQQIISLEELLLTQVVQMEYERTLLQFDYELQMMMLG